MQAVVWLLVAVGLVAADIIFETESEEDANRYSLPEGFQIGAGTSSYQTEGAWNLNGKGINVFDHYFNFEGHDDKETQIRSGNIATDAYHHINDDIELIKRLKLQVYRFSLSWARLLPDGDPAKPNPDGVRYYKEILEKLREIKVDAMVTLHHFDHPQALYKKHNSWLGLGMVDAFVEYADFAFKTFGNQVKYWVTVNEPKTICVLVYNAGLLPPGNTKAPADSFYKCLHHQLLAHGRAYRIYQEKYAKIHGGSVGLSYYSDICRPNNSTASKDKEAALRANTFRNGVIVEPVLFGDYPEVVRTAIEKKSSEKKVDSWLPKFTDGEKAIMKNSVDFLGLNIYTGTYVVENSGAPSGEPPMSMFNLIDDSDVAAVPETTEDDKCSFGHNCAKIQPWAMYDSLVYAQNNYRNISLFITENGYDDADESSAGIHDQNRAAYHSLFMRTMLDAMKDHKVNLLGMNVWSLVDSIEWSTGNYSKLGLVHVDFSSPDRTRTLKDSSAFFVKLQTERRVALVNPAQAQPPQPPSEGPQPVSGESHAAARTWLLFCMFSTITIQIFL